MSLITKRQSLIYLYCPFILIIVLAFLLGWLKTPFSISLIFLTVIFVPGFAISRVLKINFQKDNLGQFILWFTIGLLYNLIIGSIGIGFHFTLSQLIWLNVIFSGLIFVVAFVLDLNRPVEGKLNFKQYFKLENLIFIFLAGLILLVLAVVDQLGTNFTGDPLYHLSILRRAIEGQPLSIENLSHLKNQFHPTYIFPVWHVFLGLLAKISRVNIFVLYREIPTILTLFVFAVWYWFFLKILPKRNVAILALFLFILYYFGKNGYLYTRMAVPDTLNNLLLMPLSFALAIKYIFNKSSNYKHLIVLSLLLAFMGLIHWTQYFYYLSAMGLFAVIYIIFKYRESDFRLVFKKILLAIFANMILVLPILIFLQIKSNTISGNIQAFSAVTKGSNNDRFYKFPLYLQLPYIFLSLIIIFLRKYRRLTFLLAVFLVGPIVFNIPFIYKILRQNLSHVFVNRLYSNLGEWPYVLWALGISFVLVLIDRIISKLTNISKYFRYLIDSILGILLIWVIWVQYRTEQIESWYEAFFVSQSLHNWLNTNYYWLISVVFFIAVIIFIIQKYHRPLIEFFTFSEYKNSVTMLIFTLIIVFFLAMPSYGHLSYYAKKEVQNRHFFREATDPSPDFINSDKFGGMAAINFIKENIPPKSVFDTNTFANYTLSTLVDIHMASYTFDAEPTKKYEDLYNFNVPIGKKLAMINEGDIDYLIYQYPAGKSQSPFDLYPQYFTKVYQSSAAIYKINKDQVQLDLKV